jgi:ATP-binding cassette subfamily C exporter for protease/lipase
MRKNASVVDTALRQLRPYFSLALIMSVFIALLTLAPIGYMREVYGPVVTARSEQTLAWVTLLLVGALAIAACLDWVRQRIQSAAAARLAALLSEKVFDASFRANLLALPGARLALSDFRAVRNFISSPTAAVMLDAPMGLMLLGLIFAIHPIMGLLSLAGGVLSIIISVLTERAVRPVMANAVEKSQLASHYAADASRNAEAILAMGMAPAVQSRWQNIQNEYLVLQARATNKQGVGSAVTRSVMLIQGSAILGVGTALTLAGVLSPAAGGMLIVAKLIGAIAMRPMMQLITSWKQISTARDALERLRTFMEKIPLPEAGMTLPPPRGQLELKGAAVMAPGTKQTILVDQTFSVGPGQVLAVLGPSGSGKSSLARLITGIWTPRLGEVRLDGVSVSQWPKAELGRHIGFLPQDIELFDGTLAENIARFTEPDAERLEEVVAICGLDSLIDELPNGLNTQLGDDGARLSGGQRQRIALARALYGNPQLLVLDEPNANLDTQGDDALSAAILSAKARGATQILITHRREILTLADLILVLREGRPVVFGPKEKVLAQMAERGAQPT